MPILTIGHSNHTLFRFLGLLRAANVNAVADVRSAPYSKYVPQFNTDSLGRSLEQVEIGYLYRGHELGGRPEGEQYYGPDGRVLYSLLAESPVFLSGLERLIENGSRQRVAILCAEEDPNHCHRRLLIAKVLHRRGIDVEHIRGDGRVVSEAAMAAEEASQAAQLSLFG